MGQEMQKQAEEFADYLLKKYFCEADVDVLISAFSSDIICPSSSSNTMII